MNIAFRVLNHLDQDIAQSSKDLMRLSSPDTLPATLNPPTLYQYLLEKDMRLLTMWKVQDLIEGLDLDFNPPYAWIQIIGAVSVNRPPGASGSIISHLLFDKRLGDLGLLHQLIGYVISTVAKGDGIHMPPSQQIALNFQNSEHVDDICAFLERLGTRFERYDSGVVMVYK